MFVLRAAGISGGGQCRRGAFRVGESSGGPLNQVLHDAISAHASSRGTDGTHFSLRSLASPTPVDLAYASAASSLAFHGVDIDALAAFELVASLSTLAV